MFKKRNFSVYDDFKTGFFSKLSLVLGAFLLIIYVFLMGISLFSSEESGGFFGLIYDLAHYGFAESVIAFSIVFIGVGFVLYFLHLQFVKLAKIADDFEEELKDIDSKEEFTE